MQTMTRTDRARSQYATAPYIQRKGAKQRAVITSRMTGSVLVAKPWRATEYEAQVDVDLLRERQGLPPLLSSNKGRA